jgi:hypothetical protein
MVEKEEVCLVLKGIKNSAFDEMRAIAGDNDY